MRDKGYSVTANWNCVTISLIFTVICTLLVLYMPGIRSFDMHVLNSIQAMLAPFPTSYATAITTFGFANSMLWPKITVCSVLISHGRFFRAFLFIFMMKAAELTCVALKNFVGRERPCGSAYAGYSFPSNHALLTMCLYGIVIYLVFKYVSNEFWRYFLAITFGVFIFLVALSRLWLGVHFPIDVIAGLLIGLIFVNLYIILVKVMDIN